jgi:hypothetical protein
MMVKARASASVSPPAISGSACSVSSATARSSGGRLASFSRMDLSSISSSSLRKAWMDY